MLNGKTSCFFAGIEKTTWLGLLCRSKHGSKTVKVYASSQVEVRAKLSLFNDVTNVIFGLRQSWTWIITPSLQCVALHVPTSPQITFMRNVSYMALISRSANIRLFVLSLPTPFLKYHSPQPLVTLGRDNLFLIMSFLCLNYSLALPKLAGYYRRDGYHNFSLNSLSVSLSLFKIDFNLTQHC